MFDKIILYKSNLWFSSVSYKMIYHACVKIHIQFSLIKQSTFGDCTLYQLDITILTWDILIGMHAIVTYISGIITDFFSPIQVFPN